MAAKKTKKQAKEKTFQIRVTAEQFEAYQRAAADAGLDPSAWARATLWQAVKATAK